MPDVTIELLGGFKASVNGQPVSERAWRLKKARDLVKLLALARGHRLHREQLMDTLWRDRDPRSAANNLYQAVHAARRALGPEAIEVHDELIGLQAEVDVDRFEHALTEARRTGSPAAYRSALSIYAGELLPENRYDDWAASRREELQQSYSRLADECEGMDLSRGFRRLPERLSSFVGRDHELSELRALLHRTRLLTLTGVGGAGKTRLAVELARSVEAVFEDGVAFVELAAVDDPGGVADAVAAALDVRALPGQAPAEAVSDFLSPRSLLLAVDNCEHVLAASSALAGDLLRGAPRLTVLATSREPLRAEGEVVFRVPSLAIPDPTRDWSVDELLAYEAVRLLVERSDAASPGFALDDANAEDVARICFRLDGLPLALELAAGRIGALGPSSLAARLDDRFRLLRATSGSSPTRQETLEATLAWSHELLEPAERVLFRRLAVFAGGFQLDAAEAVCADELVEAPEVADTLARLVEKSLVTADHGNRERRYGLLETVRLYARQRLEEAGEADALARRHAGWALGLAERVGDTPRLDREAANLRGALDTLLAHSPVDALRLCVALWPFWLRRIDLEEAHRRFVDALGRTPEPTPLRGEALLAAAALALRGGRLALGEQYARESMEIARERNDAWTEWRALNFLGASAVGHDDPELAVDWFEQARRHAERHGFEVAAALCIYSLGVARWRLGDLQRSEEMVVEAVARLRALGDSAERVPSLLSVGESQASGGSGLEPRIVFEDTLQPFVDVSCRAAIGYALANQAGIARARGEFSRARALLEESSRRFLQDGDRRGQADVLLRLGYLELAEGSVSPAQASLERALELRRLLDDRRGVGMALAGLGLADTMAGDYDRADQRLADACDLFRRAGDRWGLTGALWNMADLKIARGEFDLAEAALEESRAVLRATGRDLWIAQATSRLADTALLRGDRACAATSLAEARSLYAAAGDKARADDITARLERLGSEPAGARPLSA